MLRVGSSCLPRDGTWSPMHWEHGVLATEGEPNRWLFTLVGLRRIMVFSTHVGPGGQPVTMRVNSLLGGQLSVLSVRPASCIQLPTPRFPQH